jgi:hypothetical protein
MFFRSKKVRNAGVTYEYLQLVESRREGDRVKQKVVLSLGRVDELRESGALDRLAQSIGRFTQQVIVLDALREGSIIAERCRDWGPSLVFDRIWWSGRPGRLPSPAPHRSGRAELPHPAPRLTDSLTQAPPVFGRAGTESAPRFARTDTTRVERAGSGG